MKNDDLGKLLVTVESSSRVDGCANQILGLDKIHFNSDGSISPMPSETSDDSNDNSKNAANLNTQGQDDAEPDEESDANQIRKCMKNRYVILLYFVIFTVILFLGIIGIYYWQTKRVEIIDTVGYFRYVITNAVILIKTFITLMVVALAALYISNRKKSQEYFYGFIFCCIFSILVIAFLLLLL